MNDLGNVVDFASKLRDRGSISGGGGGNDGRMEIDVLQRDVAGLRSDFKDFVKVATDTRERLIALEVRVAHLPSKGFIVTATSATIALLSAVFLYGDKIKAVLGT